MLFNGRNDAINFIEDYGSMILEARKKSAEEIKEQDGTALKILTSKTNASKITNSSCTSKSRQ